MNIQPNDNSLYEEYLVSQGLAQKVYVELNDGDNPDNYMLEYDPINKTERYYTIRLKDTVPETIPNVPDNQNTNQKIIIKYSYKNAIALLMKIVAILIYAVGFILGIILVLAEKDTYLYNSETGVYSFIIMLSVWGTAFISGSFFMGISEIIQLLYDIKNK